MRQKRSALTLILVMVSFVGVGCQNQKQAEHTPVQKNALQTAPMSQLQAPNPLLNQWLGKWTGPEGTFIELSKDGNKFVVKMNSLDGPAIYEGIGVGDHIEFQRDGKTETIHAGNGEDTGMKWLLDEKNCLVIKKSEGFCR
jgi:hypothetical protein